MGDNGVNIVSRLVNNQFQWIFRVNHNEHDFGIDGYIDIVTDDGGVTGQTLAVQIKTGESFFSREESDGYVFRGENKHLNYYINSSCPVLIILCHPKTEECYWTAFDPNIIDGTSNGWKMVIKKSQSLRINQKESLLALVGDPIDATEELKAQWELNKSIKEASFVYYVIAREDIEHNEFQFLIDFFKRLQLNDDMCKKSQGHVELMIHGYDHLDTELWEIPEVREWLKQVEPKIKYWFYFIKTEMPCYWLQVMMMAACDAKWINRPYPYKVKNLGQVTFDTEKFTPFMDRNFCWLDEMTDRMNMTIDDRKRIANEVEIALRLKA
ncbi:hypothetical protein CXF79_06335 [Colwellia sp. Bg11-28]|nr:hypothetical protein CXF79_06335 [Colwellia sp. Bg11-28]